MTGWFTDAAAVPVVGARRRVSLFFPLRIVLLLLMVAAIALYVRNRIVMPASLEGVVNAPLIVLRAPIDGQVVSANAAAGGIATASTSLFVVRDSRVDESRMRDLAARLDAARQHQTQIEQLLASLDDVAQDLRSRTRAYATAQETLLTATIRSQEAIIVGAASSLTYAQTQEERSRRLLQTGAAAQSRLDDSLNTRIGAQAALDRAKADRDASLVQLDSARRQIFLESGFGGSSYAQQKADEVLMRQLELRSQLGNARAESDGLAAQSSAEQSRIASLREVVVRVATQGLITSVYVADGTDVIRGNPLADVLDCRALYVEANVATTWFASPRPGDLVRITVYGSSETLHGRIRALRASGMALDPSRTTPLSERATSQSLTLIVDFDPDEQQHIAAMGCPVGRPATLLFD